MSRLEALGDQLTGTSDRQRIGIADFNFIYVLGKGNCAKVMLAERKVSKQLFAMKVFKKKNLIANDDVGGTLAEKNILVKATKKRHPFVVQLHDTFQSETRLCLVLEYVCGGDLRFHMQKEHFSQERVQFYGAEVCLALKFLHENGIVYRDTRLDNILLASDGHIKLIDFGTSKEGIGPGDTTSSFVGSTSFTAPEMLLDKPYGFAFDWWDFGVVMYQMVRRQSPFVGEDIDEIYDAILRDEPLYPMDMPRVTVSFLQKLLTREPEFRLGSGPADAEEIMKHEYFAGTDWDGLYDKRVSAPFVPVISDDTDTSNFDLEFTSRTPMLTPVESYLSQAMQNEFIGFSSNYGEV